jgi:hypothetical protein
VLRAFYKARPPVCMTCRTCSVCAEPAQPGVKARAARFLQGKASGLYDMQDVLGLR